MKSRLAIILFAFASILALGPGMMQGLVEQAAAAPPDRVMAGLLNETGRAAEGLLDDVARAHAAPPESPAARQSLSRLTGAEGRAILTLAFVSARPGLAPASSTEQLVGMMLDGAK